LAEENKMLAGLISLQDFTAIFQRQIANIERKWLHHTSRNIFIRGEAFLEAEVSCARLYFDIGLAELRGKPGV
jgi:hypothetical protein